MIVLVRMLIKSIEDEIKSHNAQFNTDRSPDFFATSKYDDN